MTDSSLDAEEKALRKGRGRMVATMIGAGVAAIVALGLYMMSGGEDTYVTFGKNINRIDGAHFDGFWACAFQGYDLRRIKNNEELGNQIHLRAREGRARYGAHLRDRCLPELTELEPALELLIPPDDLSPAVRELMAAVRELRGGVSDLIGKLDSLEGPYEREVAEEQVNRIALAWFEYRTTRGGLNKRLREKIGR